MLMLILYIIALGSVNGSMVQLRRSLFEPPDLEQAGPSGQGRPQNIVPEQAQQPEPLLGERAGEERVDLQGRVDPEVPGPLLVISQDDEGWGEIDKLGVWDCVLSPFQAIEEIPDQHR